MKIISAFYLLITLLVLWIGHSETTAKYLIAGAKFLWIFGPVATLLSEISISSILVFLVETVVFFALIVAGSHFEKTKFIFFVGAFLFWMVCGVLPYAAHV